MRMITVKGYKKTGKTTTCVRIIEELTRRGYSVGSVKNTHFPGFAMDTPGTDSDRHAKAGASTVMVMAKGETDVLFYRSVPFEELIGLYREDYLVCEGDCGIAMANIITGKTTEDLDQRRDEHTIGFSGIIAGAAMGDKTEAATENMTEYAGLPVIDAMTDVERLVDLIEERSTEL